MTTTYIIAAVVVILIGIVWRIDHQDIIRWVKAHMSKSELSAIENFVQTALPIIKNAVLYEIHTNPTADEVYLFTQAVAHATRLLEEDYRPIIADFTQLIEDAVAATLHHEGVVKPTPTKTVTKVTPTDDPPAVK